MPTKEKTEVFCKCECGQAAGKWYRAGHDARHVSVLLAELTETSESRAVVKVAAADLRRAQRRLPSEPLRAKLAAAVARHNTRAAKQAAK